METTLLGHEGNVLPARRWPCPDARAAMLLVHGLGEYSARYAAAAQALNAYGIEAWAYDQRGHGANPLGPRGYARVDDLEKDLCAALSQTAERSGLPVFLFGHSMGGGLSIRTMLHSRPDVRGAVICSPWLELTQPLPELPAKILKKHPGLFGRAVVSNGIPDTGLCHDPGAIETYADDPLIHDHVALALVGDMLRAAQYSMTNGSRLLVPMLLCHGTADGICSPEATRRFAQQCEKARFVSFEGAFHEIHNEPGCRGRLFAEIAAFVGQNL